jgi:hypothetical protein
MPHLAKGASLLHQAGDGLPSAAQTPSSSADNAQLNSIAAQSKKTRKRKAPPKPLKNGKIAKIPPSIRPLRRLAPKIPPLAAAFERRDSVIDSGDSLVVAVNPGPTSRRDFGPTSGPLKRTAHIIPDMAKTSNHKALATSPALRNDGETILAVGSTENGTVAREWLDHERGLHEGRDPYGLASRPYLDAGLTMPWRYCETCANKDGTTVTLAT